MGFVECDGEVSLALLLKFVSLPSPKTLKRGLNILAV
jgi:hypothetical protein